jgi:hypothetical protein
MPASKPANKAFLYAYTRSDSVFNVVDRHHKDHIVDTAGILFNNVQMWFLHLLLSSAFQRLTQRYNTVVLVPYN